MGIEHLSSPRGHQGSVMGDDWGRSHDRPSAVPQADPRPGKAYIAQGLIMNTGRQIAGGGSVGSMSGTDSIGERVCPADRNE